MYMCVPMYEFMVCMSALYVCRFYACFSCRHSSMHPYQITCRSFWWGQRVWNHPCWKVRNHPDYRICVYVCVHMCGALVRVFAFACACVSKQRDRWINQTWVCWGYISVNTHTPPMRAHTLTFWRAQFFHGPSVYQRPWQSWHGNSESAAGRRPCCQMRQSPGHSSSTDAAKVIVRSSTPISRQTHSTTESLKLIHPARTLQLVA